MTDAENDELEAHVKLKRKDYERKLVRLHVEFVKLQQWVVHKVRIVFEGRDGAGKGGTIKAMTDRLEARIDDGRKTGKLSDMDLEPYSRWFDHSRAIICRQRLASSPVQNPITGSTAAPLY